MRSDVANTMPSMVSPFSNDVASVPLVVVAARTLFFASALPVVSNPFIAANVATGGSISAPVFGFTFTADVGVGIG